MKESQLRKLRLEKELYHIITVYAPNEDEKDEFYEEQQKTIVATQNNNIILMGNKNRGEKDRAGREKI